MPRGNYVRLSTDYYLDPKITAAGPEAELLFVRMLALAGRLESDGELRMGQLRSLGFHHRTLYARLNRLSIAGLITPIDDGKTGDNRGYRVRKWSEWNLTRAEIDQAREDKAARQRRWRERRRRTTDTSTPERVDAPATPLDTDTDTDKRREVPERALARRGSETAGDLMAEWLDHSPDPGSIPGTVKGHVGKQLKQMLAEGIPVPIVRAGLAEWSRSDTHPAALGSFVHRAGNPGRSRPRAANGSTTDDRVKHALSLVEKYEAMEEGS